MTWAKSRYARGAFAGRDAGTSPPGGQQTLPPPIPGGTATWLYEPNRSTAYAVRGWAGRLTASNYPGGGISIRPIAARGVMEITAWWPDAPVLDLVRVDPDGTVVPVRGGSPVQVPGQTRRNLCQNPSFEAGMNGTVPDLGSPTLTNPNDGTAPRGVLYLKATIAGSGSCGVVVPTALTAMASATIGFDLRLSAAATSVTVQVSWTDITGAALTSTSATLTSNQINNSITQFFRQVVQIPASAGAASGTVKIIAGGLPAGAAMSLDGVTVEAGQTDGSYFDGSTYGATWLGTAQLSASALAPLCVVEDGECPTDVSVQYKLVNPAPIGGTMTSDRSLLPSNEKVWLTHPSVPDDPMEVFIAKRPLRGKAANQGVFQAIDDPLFLTISSRRRSAWRSTESIQLWTFGSEQTERLLTYLDDNRPVLVRTPLSLNYGPPLWISLGDLDEDPDGAGDWQEFLKLSAPWVQVAAPA
jgi:hypothetical protein